MDTNFYIAWLVSFVVSFILGWLWMSPTLLQKQWAKAYNFPTDHKEMFNFFSKGRMMFNYIFTMIHCIFFTFVSVWIYEHFSATSFTEIFVFPLFIFSLDVAVGIWTAPKVVGPIINGIYDALIPLASYGICYILL